MTAMVMGILLRTKRPEDDCMRSVDKRALMFVYRIYNITFVTLFVVFGHLSQPRSFMERQSGFVAKRLEFE